MVGLPRTALCQCGPWYPAQNARGLEARLGRSHYFLPTVYDWRSVLCTQTAETFNANGAGGQLVYNVNNWLGILGDLSGYWATNVTKAGAAMPYLFGPRASLRRGKVTPFAQLLAGGILTSSGIQTSGWQSHFAMAVGGGLDVRISRHISFRTVEAEYFLTKISDGLNNRQNNFRVGVGIVLRFG